MSIASLDGRRILILEDEGLVAMDLQDSLDDLGCAVVGPVRTVEAALSLIEGNALDAALLDVNLGDGQTSYPVAEMLRSRGIPFAFLTGYGAGSIDTSFSDNAVLAKPVDHSQLAETLEALLPADRP